MIVNFRRCWLLLPALAAFAATAAEHPVAAAQRHQQAANAAYRAGDYEGFVRSLELAQELNPSSLATKYNLACGYARTGRAEAALDLLQELVTARVDFGMAADPDLESLHDIPRFRQLTGELAISSAPVVNSMLRHTIDQLGLIAEGIALDSATGRLFFGSMRNGDVFVLDRHEQLSRFASIGDGARYAANGMAVDTGRGLLWVTGASTFPAEGFDSDNPAPAGLFGFDLADGTPGPVHWIPVEAGALNDVAVAANGNVYVSGDVLHVLRADSTGLERLPTTPEPFGANGIAISADGNTLFVSAYPVGVGVVDLASGALHYLKAPAEHPLYGIDGLYWYDGDLVGIQNGIRPWRLLRMRLAGDLSAVTAATVIESANPALTPTLGTIDGASIVYIGQGPAPDNPPQHFPPRLAPVLGKTIIMAAPLDID